MDDDGLNMRNWVYYEPTPPFRGHLGLQLKSSIPDTKPILPSRDSNLMVGSNGGYHPRDCVLSEPYIPMNYGGWINQQHRDRFFNMLPPNPPNYNLLPEHPVAPAAQSMPQQPISVLEERMVSSRIEHPVADEETAHFKKRQSEASSVKPPPKAKKPRKPRDSNNPTVRRVKPAKRSMEIVINGIDMDIASIPIPVCSCTGTPQQCYRWGCGGWQSACCTTNVSMHPLPMSTKRRGARIAGRKMSQGAFKKVLEKLAAEGYKFSTPIDLRTHWARHGTNKFVTIK